jgi:hypothetical protein
MYLFPSFWLSQILAKTLSKPSPKQQKGGYVFSLPFERASNMFLWCRIYSYIREKQQQVGSTMERQPPGVSQRISFNCIGFVGHMVVGPCWHWRHLQRCNEVRLCPNSKRRNGTPREVQ